MERMVIFNMRELNECKAEIYSRSEKRIKERKRARNHIVTFSISLCLIISLWLIIALPPTLSSKDRNRSDIENSDIVKDGEYSDTTHGTLTYVQVEVRDAASSGQSCVLNNNTNDVSIIYDTIQSLFASTEESINEVENYGTGEETFIGTGSNEDVTSAPSEEVTQIEELTPGESLTELLKYQIIFTKTNGKQIIFSINGDKLINESTRQEIVLTEAEKSEILSMLGL